MWHSGKVFKITHDTQGRSVDQPFAYAVRIQLSEIYEWLEKNCPNRYRTEMLTGPRNPRLNSGWPVLGHFNGVLVEFDDKADAAMFKLIYGAL